MVILWWFNGDQMGFNSLVICNIAIKHGYLLWIYPARKIVIFPSYVNIYQRVLPSKKTQANPSKPHVWWAGELRQDGEQKNHED